MADTTPNARFGAQRYSPTRKVRTVVADESAPTLKAEGSVFPEHTQMRWTVIKDSGVASYDIDVYLWAEAKNASDDTLIGAWVRIDTIAVIVDDSVYYQYTDGDPVAIRIYNTVGAFADQFTILTTGLNRP